jgi:HSP20 family protein
MLTLWNPYDDWGFGNLRRTLSVMDELRQQMGTLLDYGDRGSKGSREPNSSWPASNLTDQGDHLAVRAEVPGLSEKELEVSVTADTVAISGKRIAAVPSGYSAHRKERCDYQFSRSFLLPVKVNPDGARATVKNGVLELHLPKAEEAQPRKITIKAS